MTIERLPYERQENPRDEIIAYLAGARGLVSNAIDGMYSPEVLALRLRRIDEFIGHTLRIARQMPPGEWTNPVE